MYQTLSHRLESLRNDTGSMFRLVSVLRALDLQSGVVVCMYVCMYDYMAVSSRTLTPPTTGTD